MYRQALLLSFFLLSLSIFTKAEAGPPFKTDDPQPVDYLHWEVYLAAIQEYTPEETNSTIPQVEVNYGALPNLQVHIAAPMGYVNGPQGPKYGYSNTELGAKYRFLQSDSGAFQIGVFPLALIPTGDKSEGLSDGNASLYFPLWAQWKSGKLTTYGGGGYWVDFGTGNKNWSFYGWEVQYDFSDLITIGGEGYYHTAETASARPGAGFNIGGFINANDHNHVLFSIGHSVTGQRTITGYIGYQFTT
jgi:hypothetical protein